MRTLVFLLLFFQLGNTFGQKLVRKALLEPHISSIHINAHNCYQIALETHQGDEVQVLANIEGEYAPDLVVGLTERGTTIFVDAGFQPNFVNPNDKLSAHKVVSIALQIKLPEYKEVHVFGTSCNLDAHGNYRKLKVVLNDGQCSMGNIGENVEVTTQKGDIYLTVPEGNITANSDYGEILREFIPSGDNHFMLRSVEGDIHLRKTK